MFEFLIREQVRSHIVSGCIGIISQNYDTTSALVPTQNNIVGTKALVVSSIMSKSATGIDILSIFTAALE